MWRAQAIEVSDASWIRRGDTLAIGEGDETDLVHVRAVRGSTVLVVRRRWYHGRVRQARRRLLEARFAAQEALCGLRGHRLTIEDRDADGGNLTFWCWCGAQYRYDGEDRVRGGA